MLHRAVLVLVSVGLAQSATAADLRVPEDHKTIQAAVDASRVAVDEARAAAWSAAI